MSSTNNLKYREIPRIPDAELKKLFPWVDHSDRASGEQVGKRTRHYHGQVLISLMLTLSSLMAIRMEAQVGQPNCLTQFTFNAVPQPVNGIYLSGQSVQFCYTVQSFNLINNNWFHAMVPTFGSGWDLSTLNVGSAPTNCDGGVGSWMWSNGCTVNGGNGSAGPGWYYDLNSDGDPCNNFGDVGSGCTWQFCWTIQVADGPYCVSGASLDVSVDTFGDSETGSWGSPGCANDPIATLNATAVCCSADAGEDASVVLCYLDPPIEALGALNGSPDSGGDWNVPGGGSFNGIIDPATSASGNYTYTIEQASPCPDVSAELDVTIDPELALVMNEDTAICEGGTVALHQIVSGGTATYQIAWSQPLTGIGPHLVTPIQSTDYELTITDALGCSVIGHTVVIVHPLPYVLASVDDPEVCIGTTVRFTNNTPVSMVGTSCVWDMGDGTLIHDCGSFTYTHSTYNCHDITLTVTSPYGCVNDSTFASLVCIRPYPEAGFIFGPQPADMDDTRLDFGNTTEDSTGVLLFSWQFGTAGSLGTSDIPDPFFYFPDQDSGSYMVTLLAENRYGCIDSAWHTVTIDGVVRPLIPNAFTPDGDGINDIWSAGGLGYRHGSFELNVFDRWGLPVFSASDPSEGWNGRHHNTGDALPSGVYVWRMSFKSAYSVDSRELMGSVTMLR